MRLQDDALAVQRLYPMLYVACLTVHGWETRAAGPLSARECAVLSHLRADPSLSASRLAGHLGVARSTLSEVLAKLLRLRYLESERDFRDERRKRLIVTEDGIGALSSVSVLDRAKVMSALSRLTPREREKVLEGLTLLSKAVALPIIR